MRGRIYLTAGERQIELRFTTNALCRLEEAAGRSVTAIVDGMSRDMKVGDLRLLLWAGAGLGSLDEAGDIIDEIGFAEMSEAIGQAVQAAFPEAAANEKKAAAAA